jgi:hypothetical protein
MGRFASNPHQGCHPSSPSIPLLEGVGGRDIGRSLELEWGRSALVKTWSLLADVPWDPMSCEWGARSKPGSPAIVLQGGDRTGATYREPELVVDNHSEAPHHAFDPMLVEVDAYLRLGLLSVDAAAPTLMGVLGARGSLVLLGPMNLGWTPMTVAH